MNDNSDDLNIPNFLDRTKTQDSAVDDATAPPTSVEDGIAKAIVLKNEIKRLQEQLRDLSKAMTKHGVESEFEAGIAAHSAAADKAKLDAKIAKAKAAAEKAAARAAALEAKAS
jgi:hypothetical protein